MEVQNVLDEAIVNYDAGRYSDAESAFRYLLQSAVQSKNPVDVLYFCYRILEIAGKEDPTIDSVELWKNLGIYALRVARDELSSLPLRDEVSELEIRAQVHRHLLEMEKHQEMITRLVDKYEAQLASDPVSSLRKLISDPFLSNELLKRDDLFKKIEVISDSLEDDSIKDRITILRSAR